MSAQNPYVGPLPIDQPGSLHGRDREIRDVVDLLMTERFLLLYAPSGVGKTSLLRAGLPPALQKEGFTVLPVIRVGYEPDAKKTQNRYEESVLTSLKATEESLVQRINKIRKEPSSLIVLLFDQFEELLTADPDNEQGKAKFIEELAKLIEPKSSRIWVVFALREDYLAPFTHYRDMLPTSLRTTYRLGCLGAAAAYEAIYKPASKTSVPFTKAAALKLVEELRKEKSYGPSGLLREGAGSTVEPLQLQVVCHQVWQKHSDRRRPIVEMDVKPEDVDGALGKYYAENVAKAAEVSKLSTRVLRQWFERELVTTHGLRGQVKRDEGQASKITAQALDLLEQACLVRREDRHGATWLELAHDRLIKPIQHIALAMASQQELFQRRAQEWEDGKRSDDLLLRGIELSESKKWIAKNGHDVSEREKEFIQLSRKNQRRRISLMALTIAIGVLTIVSAYAVDSARQTAAQNRALTIANDEARKQRDLADQNAQEARKQKEIADQQRDLAMKNEQEAKKQQKIAVEQTLRAAKNLIDSDLKPYEERKPTPKDTEEAKRLELQGFEALHEGDLAAAAVAYAETCRHNCFYPNVKEIYKQVLNKKRLSLYLQAKIDNDEKTLRAIHREALERTLQLPEMVGGSEWDQRTKLMREKIEELKGN